MVVIHILSLQEKRKLKVKEKLDKLNKEKLLEFCDIFDMTVSSANKVCLATVCFFYKFLMQIIYQIVADAIIQGHVIVLKTITFSILWLFP